MRYQFQKCFGALLLSLGILGTDRAQAATIQVTANISGTTTWRATNEYVLDGYIYVLDGGVLNIEPGTIVKAKPGQQLAASALIVTRGGKIFAEGTRTRPIIFTAEADDPLDPDILPTYQRGLWGGVVLMGNAVLNVATDTTGNGANPKYDVMEGLPPETQINGQFVHRFGGNNDDDNSGVLRYVSIRRAGTVFAESRELNGLTLCGVGRGTTIDHIECYAIADDGVEFFGGTVNTKYFVSAFNDDDCFDIDQGYRGKNQFWFSIQERGTKDSGGEWNGEPSPLSGATPRAPYANYTIYNATFIGAGTNTTGNRALQVRDYAAPRLYNSILTEFGGFGVRVDTKSAVFLNDGTLDIRDNIWWNFATNGVPMPSIVETGTSGSSSDALVLFSDSARSNEVVNPILRGISRTNNYQLDPRPQVGSPALAAHRSTPNDGFFCDAPYKGAFSTVNWATDWTYLGERSFISASGAGVPRCTTGPTPCSSPALTIALSDGNVTVSFTSQAAFSYQVESTTDIAGAWGNEGAALNGTGGNLSYTTAAGGPQRFFRVRCLGN
jgi:hypothetical protein